MCTRLSQRQVPLPLPLLDSPLLLLHNPGVGGVPGDRDDTRKGVHVAWEHLSRGSCPSWADSRSQSHPDIWTLASLSHLLPHLILPLKSYVGFSPLPQMPFLPQLATTLAARPLKPSRLLCTIYLAYSSCPNTISSLSQPDFH